MFQITTQQMGEWGLAMIGAAAANGAHYPDSVLIETLQTAADGRIPDMEESSNQDPALATEG